MPSRALLCALACLLLLPGISHAGVVRVELRSRQAFGSYERLIGRVYFALDPTHASNRAIVDVALAPRTAEGLVEFSSDLLLFRPLDARVSTGAMLLEVVNRGRDQSLILMNGARQRSLAPEDWDLGDRFALERGFTLAFLGWQFDVQPTQGLTFDTPVVRVNGPVRASYVSLGTEQRNEFGLFYCTQGTPQTTARLTYRPGLVEEATVVPRDRWRFGATGCSVQVDGGFTQGLYEVVYEGRVSPVAGLGLAALRDFTAYMKHGPASDVLRDTPTPVTRALGFGYSQSARLLRDFVRDGFNADEQGRQVFDGLFVASAGAGGGSFNHRFAMPGQAGNSVLSILRPVDIPPFTDAALLARATAARVVPKIFYTFTSTEYWARAGSLTHTTEAGSSDEDFAPTSRLYFMAGTAHASGPLPGQGRDPFFRYDLNFAQQRWIMRALLVALDAWVSEGTAPPPSRYPRLSREELVARDGVRFPAVPSLPFPAWMPRVWRLDFGADFTRTGVIANEPPLVGTEYRVLVPQVDADGNDLAGIRPPELAVPLGTYTGWNLTNPSLQRLGYLAGLVGAFSPFPRDETARAQSEDSRRSIAARYRDKADYEAQMTRAVGALVVERFVLSEDVASVMRWAGAIWDAVVPAR
ncbi:MAG: alpha/beta hydrolase domain-containing protein [Vicinamibacterales bacterium]